MLCKCAERLSSASEFVNFYDDKVKNGKFCKVLNQIATGAFMTAAKPSLQSIAYLSKACFFTCKIVVVDNY